MFGVSRGDMPEPPPPQVAGLGLAPGYSIRRFDSVSALNDYAKANGVSASDAWNPHQIESAVVPAKQEVLLMKPGYFDPAKEQAVEAHEFAHSWGLVHGDDGKGWNGTPDVWGRINMVSAMNARVAQDAAAAQQLAPSMTAAPTTAEPGPMTATNALTGAPIPDSTAR